MKKYAEIPKNDDNHKIENAWLESCRERRVPFITVRPRTKYADVNWDYIAFPAEYDAVIDRHGVKLRDEAICIFMKYANKKSEYEVSGRLAWYKNLEIESARLAAEELYDLIAASVK